MVLLKNTAILIMIFTIVVSNNKLFAITLPPNDIIKRTDIPIYADDINLGVSFDLLFANRFRANTDFMGFFNNFYTYINYSYWYNGVVDNTPLESAISLSRHSYYGATGYKFNLSENKAIYVSISSDGEMDLAGSYKFWSGSTALSIAYKDTNMLFSLYVEGESEDTIFDYTDFYIAANAYYDIYMITLMAEVGYHTYYDIDASLGILSPIASFADAFLTFRYFFSMPTEYEIKGGLRFYIFDYINIETTLTYYQIKGIEYNIGFVIPIGNYIKKYSKNENTNQ